MAREGATELSAWRVAGDSRRARRGAYRTRARARIPQSQPDLRRRRSLLRQPARRAALSTHYRVDGTRRGARPHAGAGAKGSVSPRVSHAHNRREFARIFAAGGSAALFARWPEAWAVGDSLPTAPVSESDWRRI